MNKKVVLLIVFLSIFSMTGCGKSSAGRIQELLERVPLLSHKWNFNSEVPNRRHSPLNAASMQDDSFYVNDVSKPTRYYTNFRDADEYKDMIIQFDTTYNASKRVVENGGDNIGRGWELLSHNNNHFKITHPIERNACGRLELKYNSSKDQLYYDFYSLNVEPDSRLLNDVYLQRELEFLENEYYKYVEQYSWIFDESFDRTLRTEYYVDLSSERPRLLAFECDTIINLSTHEVRGLEYRIRYIEFKDDYLFFYWFNPKGGEVYTDDLWVFDWNDGKPILEYNIARGLELDFNLFKFDGWSKFVAGPIGWNTGCEGCKITLDDGRQIESVASPFNVACEFYHYEYFSGWPTYVTYEDNPSYENILKDISDNYGLTPQYDYDLQPAFDLTASKLEGQTFGNLEINSLDYDYVTNEVNNAKPTINEQNIDAFLKFSN